MKEIYTKEELNLWFDYMKTKFRNCPMFDHLAIVQLTMMEDDRYSLKEFKETLKEFDF